MTLSGAPRFGHRCSEVFKNASEPAYKTRGERTKGVTIIVKPTEENRNIYCLTGQKRSEEGVRCSELPYLEAVDGGNFTR